jgi:hypothetical protein
MRAKSGFLFIAHVVSLGETPETDSAIRFDTLTSVGFSSTA